MATINSVLWISIIMLARVLCTEVTHAITPTRQASPKEGINDVHNETSVYKTRTPVTSTLTAADDGYIEGSGSIDYDDEVTTTVASYPSTNVNKDTTRVRDPSNNGMDLLDEVGSTNTTPEDHENSTLGEGNTTTIGIKYGGRIVNTVLTVAGIVCGVCFMVIMLNCIQLAVLVRYLRPRNSTASSFNIKEIPGTKKDDRSEHTFIELDKNEPKSNEHESNAHVQNSTEKGPFDSGNNAICDEPLQTSDGEPEQLPNPDKSGIAIAVQKPEESLTGIDIVVQQPEAFLPGNGIAVTAIPFPGREASDIGITKENVTGGRNANQNGDGGAKARPRQDAGSDLPDGSAEEGVTGVGNAKQRNAKQNDDGESKTTLWQNAVLDNQLPVSADEFVMKEYGLDMSPTLMTEIKIEVQPSPVAEIESNVGTYQVSQRADDKYVANLVNGADGFPLDQGLSMPMEILDVYPYQAKQEYPEISHL